MERTMSELSAAAPVPPAPDAGEDKAFPSSTAHDLPEIDAIPSGDSDQTIEAGDAPGSPPPAAATPAAEKKQEPASHEAPAEQPAMPGEAESAQTAEPPPPPPQKTGAPAVEGDAMAKAEAVVSEIARIEQELRHSPAPDAIKPPPQPVETGTSSATLADEIRAKAEQAAREILATRAATSEVFAATAGINGKPPPAPTGKEVVTPEPAGKQDGIQTDEHRATVASAPETKTPAQPKKPAADATRSKPPYAAGVELCLVRGNTQIGGPDYNFFMGKYEITNLKFCEFLNSAIENPKNMRGGNMFFDEDGNVFMSEDKNRLKRLFAATQMDFGGEQTGIAFEAGKFTPAPGMEEHPVMGVTWFGALKFCNWLTMESGLSEQECCYSEGARPEDWRPVNLSLQDWVDGFSDEERRTWISAHKGFRLPMNNYGVAEGRFNEYFLAAAWNGSENTLYGFGRDEIDGADANYRDSGYPAENGTAPVGFYDGSDHGGVFQTRGNANIHGIHDLSGNVWEWSSDTTGNIAYRTLFGGSWDGKPETLRVSFRGSLSPHNACRNVGFRVVTTRPESK